MPYIFDWDTTKARSKLKKHEVSFEEAATVLDDQLAAHIDDPDHSIGEQRSIIMGISAEGNLLVVIYTEPAAIGTQPPGVVRIISARRAEPRERRNYEKHG